MVPSAAEVNQRVGRVRELMAEEGVDAILVRSTDRYLNEYVPLAESTRVWLTGFTGSTGDALVTRERAWVAVDGRYYLQADTQTEGTPFDVERVPLGTSISSALIDLVKACSKQGVSRVGFEPDRFSMQGLESLGQALEGSGVELVPTKPSLIERARGGVDEPVLPIRAIDEQAVGRTVSEKVALARVALQAAGVDAFVVQRLDSLAYLTNLRGEDLPYQATFRGLGLLTQEAVHLALDAERLEASVRADRGKVLKLVSPDGWLDAVQAGWRVGYDPAGTTTDVVQAIEQAGAEAISMASPIAALKATKTNAELAAMQAAFRKADGVVEAAMAFVRGRLDNGKRVTEKDLADAVARLFTESGAVGLSFKVIAAAGENGAVIHYSTPDPQRVIEGHELVLLDTGGYYAEGYATDLTRTFLAGSPAQVPEATAEQRRVFTLVLKAAIAGMSARIPVGTRGDQLDAIVRAPLWAEGLDFNHGTGHGVGINVHEAPPRVSTKSTTPIEVGHVFSIEPGLYLPGFGGVRIENLCTVLPAEGARGFLDVVPLTFALFDRRLIDDALLEPKERSWLDGYLSRCESKS